VSRLVPPLQGHPTFAEVGQASAIGYFLAPPQFQRHPPRADRPPGRPAGRPATWRGLAGYLAFITVLPKLRDKIGRLDRRSGNGAVDEVLSAIAPLSSRGSLFRIRFAVDLLYLLQGGDLALIVRMAALPQRNTERIIQKTRFFRRRALRQMNIICG